MSDLARMIDHLAPLIGLREILKAEGRAKKGGETGVNGQQYEGGQFLPGSPDTDKGANKSKAGHGSGKQEVGPYEWAVPPAEGARSIYSRIQVVIDHGAMKSTGEAIPAANFGQVCDHYGWDRAETLGLMDRYNAGERWAIADRLSYNIPPGKRALGRLLPISPSREMAIIQVDTRAMRGEELDLHRARRWAMANVSGTVKNEALGVDISVSSKGIKEAIAHLNWSKVATIQTLAAIPDLIRDGIPVQSAPDVKGRPDIIHVHTLIAPLEVDGEIFRARMTVRETNVGHKYYGHRLEDLDIEMPEAFSGGHASLESLGVQRHSGTISMGRLLEGFKPHTEE